MLADRVVSCVGPLVLLVAMSLSPEHVGYESEECNDSACSYRVHVGLEHPFVDAQWTRIDAYERFARALSDSTQLYRCRLLYPPARRTVEVRAYLDRDLASQTWSVRMEATDSALTTLLAWPKAPVPSSELEVTACIKAETEHMLREHPLPFDVPYRANPKQSWMRAIQ